MAKKTKKVSVNQIFRFNMNLVYYIGTYNYSVDGVTGITMRSLVDITGFSYDYINREINKIKKLDLIEIKPTDTKINYINLSKKGDKIYKAILNLLVEF